jgi:hypothetical protein
MNKQQLGREATSCHEQSSDVPPLAHAAEFSSHFGRQQRNSLLGLRCQEPGSAISLIRAARAAPPRSTRSIAGRKNSSGCGDPQDCVRGFPMALNGLLIEFDLLGLT